MLGRPFLVCTRFRLVQPTAGHHAPGILTKFSVILKEVPRFATIRMVPEQAERLRVLVVDDEPSIVDVVSMALRHHGYEVAVADTGTRALARSASGVPTRSCLT